MESALLGDCGKSSITQEVCAGNGRCGWTLVRYRRNFVAGGTFFFTVALADRHSDMLTAHIGTLRAAFRLARAERPFQIDAIVVLPDHLHAILTLPEGDADFSGRWRRIKGAFTHDLRRGGVTLQSRGGAGYALWQRRFWEHTIRDEADFLRHVAYIHFNPVKHGYVNSAVAWPYSSIHVAVRRGLVAADWGGAGDDIGGVVGEAGPR
jgi:putative transposase